MWVSMALNPFQGLKRTPQRGGGEVHFRSLNGPKSLSGIETPR